MTERAKSVGAEALAKVTSGDGGMAVVDAYPEHLVRATKEKDISAVFAKWRAGEETVVPVSRWPTPDLKLYSPTGTR